MKAKIKSVLIFNIIMLALLGLTCCRDKSEDFYLVNKVKTPTAQFFATSNSTNQGCITGLYSSEIWCQQFPIRPSDGLNSPLTGGVKLSFTTLSPQNTNVSLSLKYLKIFDLNKLNGAIGNGSRGSSVNIPSTEIPMSDFSIKLNSTFSSTVQTSPMQIQKFVFDLVPPTLAKLISYALTYNFFPGFQLYYESSSPSLSSIDKGFLTFYILPDPTDTTSWASLQKSLPSIINQTLLTQISALSKAITPIQINNLTPNNGTISASSDNELSAQITLNPNSNSYSRIQWYVSSGSILNERALSTTWNPTQTGNVSVFLVVRDLLGGLDSKYTNLTAN